MSNLEFAACCGIYCPDCFFYQNRFSRPARRLRESLAELEFEKYAAIKSEFGKALEHYDQFQQVLDFLAHTECQEPCRPQDGCVGRPCAIMECAAVKGLEGCWQCPDMEACNKFEFMKPRCGDMPKENLRQIKKLGLEKWVEKRSPYYVWLKAPWSPNKK
ncbi:MAG: DUF3795 domain-containing protein [Desulfarculaceae bacterium]|jgi:hypothetical protein